MGHKMDTVYLSGKHELGCLEIGGCPDSTKSLKDGKIKMPIVLKDMLLSIIANTDTKPQDIHLVGYIINGKFSFFSGYSNLTNHLQEMLSR